MVFPACSIAFGIWYNSNKGKRVEFMVELITKFLSLAVLLLGWFFGKAAERKKRAKEIAKQFKEVTVKGDSLFDQVWKEMNQRSDTNWEDIPVRNNNQEGDSND